MGSAPAPGAVRRAPRRTLKHTGKPAEGAIGEGAVGCTRGGRAPQGGCAPHPQSSIFHPRFHNQSGGKRLKLSITALLFVTTGMLYQLVIGLPKISFVIFMETTLVTMLLKRTTARVAISDTI